MMRNTAGPGQGFYNGNNNNNGGNYRNFGKKQSAIKNYGDIAY
jgi:hypothetical protein